jgi:hypothetical protein
MESTKADIISIFYNVFPKEISTVIYKHMIAQQLAKAIQKKIEIAKIIDDQITHAFEFRPLTVDYILYIMEIFDSDNQPIIVDEYKKLFVESLGLQVTDQTIMYRLIPQEFLDRAHKTGNDDPEITRYYDYNALLCGGRDSY